MKIQKYFDTKFHLNFIFNHHLCLDQSESIMNRPAILCLYILLFLAFPAIGFAADFEIDSLALQQEKQKSQEKAAEKKTDANTAAKPETKPDIKPEITTIPKARKQLRPTVVKPVIVVKPIKVIKPKIKKP
jgi:hypothetical protein